MVQISWDQYNNYVNKCDESHWPSFRIKFQEYAKVGHGYGFIINHYGLKKHTGLMKGKYIAISHTWSDKSISPNELCKLYNSIKNTYCDTDIWCDLISAPIDAKAKDGIINIMHAIYSKADAVVVVLGKRDSIFMKQSIATGDNEMVKRDLKRTKWANRVWTLQEALLANNLYVFSNDKMLRIENRRHIIHEKIKTGEFLDYVVKPKSLDYWQVQVLRADRVATLQEDYERGTKALCNKKSHNFSNIAVPRQILTCQAGRSKIFGLCWVPEGMSTYMYADDFGHYMTNTEGQLIITGSYYIHVELNDSLYLSRCRPTEKHTHMVAVTITKNFDMSRVFIAEKTNENLWHYCGSVNVDVEILPKVRKISRTVALGYNGKQGFAVTRITKQIQKNFSKV